MTMTRALGSLALGLILAGQAGAKPLAGEELGKRYLECWGYYNAGDDANFANCWADKAVNTSLDESMPDVKGRAAVVAQTKTLKAPFPDLKGEVQLVLVSGANVAAIALMKGTHDQPMKTPMGDIPASHRKVGFLVFHAVKLDARNQAVKAWNMQDAGTLLAQVGASPGPARPVMDKGWSDAPHIVVARGDAGEKQNLAAFKKTVAAVNKEDVPALTAQYAEGAVLAQMSDAADITGKEAITKYNQEFFAGLTGKMSCASTWAAGDYVVGICSFSGKNDGDLPQMGLTKTGRPIKFNVVEVVEYDASHLIKRDIGFFNGLVVARQLGLVPEPPHK